MKKLIVLAAFIIIGLAASVLTPKTAFATNGCPTISTAGACITVTLVGNIPSGASVSATNGFKDTFSFQRIKTNTYTTNNYISIPCVNGGCSIDPRYTSFSITVMNSSGQNIAQPTPFRITNYLGNNTISVNVSSSPVKTASLSGTIYDKSASGQYVTATSCSTGVTPPITLTGAIYGFYTTTLGPNGTYSFANLSPGKYTISGQLNNPGNPNTCGGFNNSFTVNSGKNTQDFHVATANPSPSKTSNPPPANAAPTCESEGGNLAWLICAVVNGVSHAEGALERIVQELLVTPVFNFSPNTNCQVSNSNPANSAQCSNDKLSANIYKVWSNMREYGDILLIIALLAAIIVEAIGGGVLEAYSVRKMLPRILVAAILINISIYLVAAAEDITNIIGSGIYDLIKTPFGSSWHLSLNGNGNMFGIAGGILAVLTAGSIWALVKTGGGAAIGDALMFIALMIGLPVLMAVLGVLLTIMFRQAILVLLVMVSPLAFALYCFPNTEQYFKKWWDFLLKTLLVYPIIMIVFAMCGVAAVVFNLEGQVGNSSDAIYTFMSLLAVAAPLFLIPFSFKFAGGAIGSIHESISGLGKKATEAIKGDKRDPNSLRNRVGRRFEARRNEAGLTGSQIGMALNPRFLKKGGMDARREARSDVRAGARARLGQQLLERSDVWQHNKEDSKFLLAHANESLAQQRMEAAQQAASRATNPEERDAKLAEAEQWRRAINTAKLVPRSQATQMASAQAWVASGYDLNSDGQTAYNEIAETMAGLTGARTTHDTGGNVNGFEGPNAGAAVAAMNEAQAKVGRQGGQWHLAGINYGTGYDPDLGLKKAGLYEIANGKADGINAMVGKLGLPAVGPMSPTQAHDAAVTYKELQAMLPNSKGGVRDAIIQQMDGLESKGINSYLSTPTGRMVTGERLDRTALATQAQAAIAGGDNRAAPTAPLDPNWTWEKEAARQGWTAQDISRGSRDRPETLNDIATREARSYERPNPDIQANPPSPPPSDARLKRDIHLVGKYNDINLYSFRYLWSDQVYVGVMAQELLGKYPEAVVISENGYYLVNYQALGTQMYTIEQWETLQGANTYEKVK